MISVTGPTGNKPADSQQNSGTPSRPRNYGVHSEVRKFGCPHALVMAKADQLFKREATAHEDALGCLDWLVAVGR
jgi:hypothetical protein